uniref:TGF-beta family profile domain-containing protein n=1 Tax=Oncorhynchus mykiss TaxID=8022 RepID=A0A8K9UU00_ONCMY
MRSLLKLVVLLFCVQRGEGHWMRSLLGSGFGVEDQRGSVPSPAPIIPIRSRRSSTQCRLRSILLQVRELGLGYDADETVLFKYCSGDCPRQNGELWQNGPCCRPTHHEDLAFLDNAHRWHKVEKLSAAGCTCVG